MTVRFHFVNKLTWTRRDKPCTISKMDCNSVPVPVLISSSGSPPSGEHDIIRPTPRRPKEGPSPSAGMTSSQEEDVVVKPTHFGSSVEKVGKVLQRKLSNTSSIHSGHSLTKKTVPVKQKSSPVELVPERDSNPRYIIFEQCFRKFCEISGNTSRLL